MIRAVDDVLVINETMHALHVSTGRRLDTGQRVLVIEDAGPKTDRLREELERLAREHPGVL